MQSLTLILIVLALASFAFVGIPAIIAFRNAKNAVERKMFFKALVKQFIYLTALGLFGCFAGGFLKCMGQGRTQPFDPNQASRRSARRIDSGHPRLRQGEQAGPCSRAGGP